MRALLLAPELFRAEGGIARILRAYLKALADLSGPGGRVDAVVLNDSPGRDPRAAAYGGDAIGEIVGCERRRLRFIGATLRLARSADHLVCGHLHLLPVAWLARRLNRRLRYSLVAHGIEVWRPYTALERRALDGAHRILCVSDYTRRQMLRFHPRLRPEVLRVVPNTLDPTFAVAAADDAAAATDTKGTRAPLILSVGRLSAADAYKGFDTAIEALPLIRREFPDARLRLVGGGDDSTRLRALAADRGVADAVEFAGIVSDKALRASYAACDVFVLPSSREGFGLVFLEAMSHGKPCVGVRSGGAPEVIADAVGHLVPYAHVPELAAVVVELLRNPCDSSIVRRHAAAFTYPTFPPRLAAALSS